MGPMAYLACAGSVGVGTAVVLQAWSGRPVVQLMRVPARAALAGFFGVALYTIMLGIAVGTAARADVAQVMLLNYLWPIWIVLLGIVLMREGVETRLAVSGAVLGFAGVVIARGAAPFVRP